MLFVLIGDPVEKQQSEALLLCLELLFFHVFTVSGIFDAVFSVEIMSEAAGAWFGSGTCSGIVRFAPLFSCKNSDLIPETDFLIAGVGICTGKRVRLSLSLGSEAHLSGRIYTFIGICSAS
jgi:hypothetical protein